ncbi:formylglycine-generating enzyme family protein [Methanolobus halotolerans]|uniref:Formylglycine-generating enzyme family protein n=2 Tax=Methanolobus halotolerans TaxID=2052935 RepID=A0A4E0PXQ2_9EURY|nr:formylglycine-generating enzyme family protein [Methanolobus halotolerans]
MDDTERKRIRDGRLRKEHEEADEKKPASIKNSIDMEFVLIPAGEFQTGSEHSNRRSIHKVIVTKPFYLGKYPVTQREWKALIDNDPSCFEGDELPVECVSWYDVQEFVKSLNTREGTDRYRLPSGAEWEYACRAGTTTKYSFGDAESELGEYAWYYENSEHRTHPAGQKKPNPWGLYDMHGNVWEWCQDKYHKTHQAAPADRSARVAGNISGLVLRGGGWVNYAGKCRSACRSSFHPNYGYYSLGFRLLRSV